jgi:histidyl-tRNA synthetase
MTITSIRGMNDILPGQVGKWQLVESAARKIFARFGFQEVRMPILEKTELFARSIGEATDIVEKEMYTFADLSGELITLRPEATASVVRAFIEHRLHQQPTMRKLYTIGPMFRHERPQKGRYRQFHQINVEAFAIEDPLIDAEIIYMLLMFLSELKISDVQLHLNSLGCTSCRLPFREALRSYLGNVKARLCPDCQRRRLSNPLRVFDCKVKKCRELLQGAPLLLDFLCEECRGHFQKVQEQLGSLEVTFSIDPYMVRGLDYYTKTTFEVLTEHLGAQNAVGGGGRYDGLMQALGGPDLPAIGFAIGMERLIMLLPGGAAGQAASAWLFVACVGDEAQRRGFRLIQQLRRHNLTAEMDYESRSLKAQMRRADKLGATHVLILGDDELARGVAVLRGMAGQKQEEIPLEGIVQRLASQLGVETNQQS